MCFYFLYNFCRKLFSFQEEMSQIWSQKYIGLRVLSWMYIGLHVKYLFFLSDYNETWIFSTDFQKNTQISHFMKIRPVGAELFHAEGHRQTDRQTDTANLTAVLFLILPTRLKKNFYQGPTFTKFPYIVTVNRKFPCNSPYIWGTWCMYTYNAYNTHTPYLSILKKGDKETVYKLQDKIH